eukprot:TRINITY_DN8139_c0_g1_i1.p2 TRINITY_DN8139_c0_g1~~TRINITY_DN8139_c0_g1_i1.p2  ORF type:complete len:303 (+),score=74.23 TRINITY_DN8139_c0_g1_i1:63-911(+)
MSFGPDALDMTLDDAISYVENYDCHAAYNWVVEHPEVPIVTIIKYLMIVFIGPMIIPVGKGVKGGLIKFLFAMWNWVLGMFSIVGAVVCVVYLMEKVEEHSLEELICNDDMMWERPDASCYGPMGFFMTAFMFSKFPELGDTLFLLIMGKPIVTLQWYHHATVLAYSWFAYASATPTAMFFGTMNYCVHSVMYTYFAFSQYTRVFSFLRPFITLIQLGQMFLGLAINLYTYHLATTKPCSKSYTETYFTACTVLYFSYFVLFAKLFYTNYIGGGSKKKEKAN